MVRRRLSKFKEVKMINCEISPEKRFYLDETGFLGNTKTFSTVLKQPYFKYRYLILGILNSSLMNYYHKKIASPKAGGFYYKTQFIEKYPIVLSEENYIEKKILDIISARALNANTKTLKKEVDLFVYKLYKLSYAEASIIEQGNPDWMTKEEFEAFTLKGEKEVA